MSNNNIAERVMQIVKKCLSLEGDYSYDASFIDDMDADSLSVVEIIMAFEDEFDIVISDEEAEKIQTINDAVEFITKKTA